MPPPLPRLSALITLLLLPALTFAVEADSFRLDLTGHRVGFASIAIVVVAYGFVMAEEFTHPPAVCWSCIPRLPANRAV